MKAEKKRSSKVHSPMPHKKKQKKVRKDRRSNKISSLFKCHYYSKSKIIDSDYECKKAKAEKSDREKLKR